MCSKINDRQQLSQRQTPIIHVGTNCNGYHICFASRTGITNTVECHWPYKTQPASSTTPNDLWTKNFEASEAQPLDKAKVWWSFWYAKQSTHRVSLSGKPWGMVDWFDVIGFRPLDFSDPLRLSIWSISATAESWHPRQLCPRNPRRDLMAPPTNRPPLMLWSSSVATVEADSVETSVARSTVAPCQALHVEVPYNLSWPLLNVSWTTILSMSLTTILINL